MSTERSCSTCGNRLTTAQDRFCSRGCADVGRRATVERTCTRCGTSFAVKPSRIRHLGEPKFCGQACRLATIRKHDRPPTLPCTQCGKLFKTSGRRAETQFCSHRCHSESLRKPPSLLTCEQCGRERSFPSGVRVGRFCSIQCSARSRLRRQRRECAVCSRSFEVPAAIVSYGGGRYCSRACQHRRSGDPVHRICPQCSRPFSLKPSKADRKFCSQPCYFASRRRATMQACERPQCRKVFRAYPSEGPRRFCSRRCYDRSRRPRRFKCPICRSWAEFRAYRPPKFCSLPCAYRGRGHSRNPEVLERNRRILDLKAQGLKAPAIRDALLNDRRCVPGPAGALWRIGTAAVRQVICRDQELLAAR